LSNAVSWRWWRTAAATLVSVAAFGWPGAASLAFEPLNSPVAGEVGVSVTEDGKKIIYTSAFFQQFAPVTARDILRQIPGLTSLSRRSGAGQERRGFGSNTDPVLINGRRSAGKGNDGESRLGRIPADQVLRVVVIREVPDELSAAGAGQVVDFVLRSDSTISGNWELEGSRFDGGTVRPGAEWSFRRVARSLTYQGDLELEPTYRPEDGLETVADPSGLVQEQAVERRLTEGWESEISGQVAYSFGPAHQVQIDGQYTREEEDEENFLDGFDVADDGTLLLDESEAEFEVEEELAWEIGVDYQRPLAEGGELRLVMVHRTEEEDEDSTEGELEGEGFEADNRELENQRARETVLRPTYRVRLAEAHKIEAGLEGAVNTLRSDLRVLERQGGEFVEVEVQDARARVEEDRWEGFVAHDWRIGEPLNLRSILAVETSDLRHEGDRITDRSFTFFKPDFELRYDLSPHNQLRFVVRRDVEQLDFGDFVSTFDQDDDEVDEGNPELRPQTSWDFEVSAEHRLADDAGVLFAEGFYSALQDVIDLIPTSEDDSAPGNIGRGRVFGVRAEASIRLDRFNLEGALLTGRLLWQESRVRDPFTGESRRFSGEPAWEYAIGLRHDITRWELGYGIDLADEDVTYTFDINETDRWDRDVRLGFFVEKRLGEKLLLRLSGLQLLGDDWTRRRETFEDPLGERRLASVEQRTRERGPEIRLTLRGRL
jgi:hypothetical protein